MGSNVVVVNSSPNGAADSIDEGLLVYEQSKIMMNSAPGPVSPAPPPPPPAALDGGSTTSNDSSRASSPASASRRNCSPNAEHSDAEANSPQRKLSPRSRLVPFVDPLCNPKKPVGIKFSDISSAAFNIRDGIVCTPTVKSNTLSSMFSVDMYLKKEYLQVTGSFKERGARFALMRLGEQQKRIGVIAASAGNHALALAYHGQQLNIPVTVVMPKFAPLMKISSCEAYGAEVILHGLNIQECKIHAYELARDRQLHYVNGFDNPDVIAGQGTIGLEILEQINKVDAILVPVGGGGLIAGIALAVKTLKPQVMVIGIESEMCPSFYNAMNKIEEPMFPELSLADGLSVPAVGHNALLIADGLIDQMVTVCEESIALAILRLIEIEKSVVEGGGAVGLAAFISGKLDHLQGKKVVSILTGGNIDTTVLGRTIERGLAVDGRLIKFDVVVSDRPGGIAELTMEVAKLGASIKDIFHERAWLAANVHSVQVRVICETRGTQHVGELMQALGRKYKQITFTHSFSPKLPRKDGIQIQPPPTTPTTATATAE